MSHIGRVVNGVVILPPGILLPEGAEVKVEPVQTGSANDAFTDAVEQILRRDPDANADAATDLPNDLAVNLDYYLHGHVRKQQPRTGRWIEPNGNHELTNQEASNDADQLQSMAAETS